MRRALFCHRLSPLGASELPGLKIPPAAGSGPHEGFVDEVESRLGVTVEFFPVGNRTTAINALRFEQVDIVLAGPSEYVLMAERVGLAHLAARRTDTLSGGQQQRVAIARMLMQDAEIVLADEPVASLDPRAGREVMELLWSVVRERKMTVLCVLHQVELAREYGERLIGLRAGRLAFDRPAQQVGDLDLTELYQTQPTLETEPDEPSVVPTQRPAQA
ncbi:ATP-binding cassette domain-containing protein [Halomonas alkalicola]